MAKAAPALKIKTIFTPSTFVCLLALSLCSTPTSALPIASERSNDASSIQSLRSNLASSSSSDSPRIAPSGSSPFRTVSRPITIQVDLHEDNDSLPSPSRLALLIENTEQREQHLRQYPQQPQPDAEELARLEQEQDELEKVEQDRDQLLDNQEEEQLDQDPETVRRRQEESLGLWMTDVEFETLGSVSNKDSDSNSDNNDDSNEDETILDNDSFDLYAEDFKEVNPEEEDEEIIERTERIDVSFRPAMPRTRSLRFGARKLRLERQEPPTEEEMLQWPIINVDQFEDRQDEIQDEYDEQAF